MTTEALDLQYCFFIVDERPLCLWDTDIRQRNLKFLNSIDPSYFDYLYTLHSQTLNSEDEAMSRKAQYAALALRAAYAQALETLFALIFSAIQAPGCVPAWINAYTNSELRNLVRKVQEKQQIISLLNTVTPSWSTIFEFLFPTLCLDNKSYESALRDGFTRTWSFFAHDFLDESSVREYNSIKHGLRIESGGFKLQIGLIEEPGVRPSEDKMMEVTSSNFGSSYVNSEKIGNWAYHLRLKGELRNWNLESLNWGLQLASMSIKNVLSALKVINGSGSQFEFSYPEDISNFNRWRGFTNMTNPEIKILPEFISSFTKEEILLNYKAGNYFGTRKIIFTDDKEVTLD